MARSSKCEMKALATWEGQGEEEKTKTLQVWGLGRRRQSHEETGRWQNLPSGSTFSYFSVFSMISLHKNKIANRLEAGQERIKTLGAGLERWPS